MPRTTTFVKDVDNEMALLLAIAVERAHPCLPYPPHVVAALETAYCTHFRAFMEFVHNGRPSPSTYPPRSAKQNRKDILLNDLAGKSLTVPWTRDELRRFAAADKLGAHLSRGRALRRRTKRYWGDASDHSLIVPRIKETFQHVPAAKQLFPRTAKLLPLFP